LASIPFKKLSIPLSSVEEGVSTVSFRTVHPDLCLEKRYKFPHEIEIEARISTLGGDFLVDLEVKSEGEFLCDRCGKEFRRVITGEIQTLFTFDRVKADEEGGGEVRILPPSAQEIDITQDVWDALLLAIPAKSLCHEGCLGLCPRCGAKLNEEKCRCPGDEVDPRWEALKNIKSSEASPLRQRRLPVVGRDPPQAENRQEVSQ
jgi:uncharacterized protein